MVFQDGLVRFNDGYRQGTDLDEPLRNKLKHVLLFEVVNDSVMVIAGRVS